MTIIKFSLYSNANWTQLSIYLSKCVRADKDKEKNKLKKKKNTAKQRSKVIVHVENGTCRKLCLIIKNLIFFFFQVYERLICGSNAIQIFYSVVLE